MELIQIFNFYVKNIKWILVTAFVGGVIGLGLNHFLPTKYYATGSLYVRRAVYPYAEDHFTYEGYYGQQAALSHTNSVIGLIESEDIRAKTLTDLSVPVTEKSLRQYDKKIKTAKNGPQIITLITKELTAESAIALWTALADNTITIMENINQRGDPLLNVVKVSELPIVKKSFREAWVFATVGTLLGIFFSSAVITTSGYLRNGKTK